MWTLAVVAGIVWASPAHAATVLWVGGTGGSLAKLIPSELFGTTGDLLGSVFKDEPITTIDYPSSLWPVTGVLDPTLGTSVNDGTTNLLTAAVNAKGPLVVVGTSQGALVVQQAEAALNDDPRVPSDTTFIMIANPSSGVVSKLAGSFIPVFDYVPEEIPETRFNTIIVINQYDVIADPIKRPWNLVTDLNALMAFVYVHPFAQLTDLSKVPAENITTTTNSQNGTTTIYRVPTNQLPLTMPLRQLQLPGALVDAIDNQLRPVIDEGYADVPPTSRTNVSPRRTAPARIAAADRHVAQAVTRSPTRQVKHVSGVGRDIDQGAHHARIKKRA